jgi:phosphoglycerate dehydrogenase-like enzyme
MEGRHAGSPASRSAPASMVKVLLADPALANLADRFAERLPQDVTIAAVTSFDEAEFREAAADATILVDARRPIGATELAMAPRLRFVQMIGAGTDPLDLAALAKAGVVAAYNPGVNRTGAAEHTIMLMLALIKRLPASERLTRAGAFAPGEIIARGIDDLADATVGIVGMGHIGRAVAERLVAFGSRIVYHARRPVAEVEERFGATRLPLDELLRSSNIITLHIPLTQETHHLIGAAEMAAMPDGSWLVNVGRGGLVDEIALRSSITSGHLAGAALDVLEHETDGTNPFADVPDAIVTPHLGGGSRNSISATIERSTGNIRRFLAGEPLHDEVPLDPDAG